MDLFLLMDGKFQCNYNSLLFIDYVDNFRLLSGHARFRRVQINSRV